MWLCKILLFNKLSMIWKLERERESILINTVNYQWSTSGQYNMYNQWELKWELGMLNEVKATLLLMELNY